MIGNNERNRQSLIFSSEHQISTWFRFFTLHFSHAAKISFRIFSPKENSQTHWIEFHFQKLVIGNHPNIIQNIFFLFKRKIYVKMMMYIWPQFEQQTEHT